MQKKYDFNLLLEEVTEEDLFEDQTHDKIADSIVRLIENESNGITIGLEGPWGSGKSSVISILKKKLDNEKGKKVSIFKFDTWAHEGDYLRRIFLTSFLNDLMIDLKSEGVSSLIEEELTNCLDKISNHKTTKTIIRKRTLTSQGIFFTLSALLVPFGAAFLSNINLDNAALSGAFYPKLFIGLLTVFAPIIFAFYNLIRLTIKKIYLRRTKNDFNIFNSEHWSFLQDKDNEDETKEFSEENERTSVEFEDQFFKILGIIFNNDLLDNIIVVIDNLDRVDNKYALKVWATLQIFLQERNDTSDKKKFFDRIWTLVPYDPNGLKNLWDTNGDNSNSKSFFDKCFQLRIDVPKPIFSSWEKYTRDIMKKSIPNWGEDDKKCLIDILRLTRKNITDIPTPRELKNYINQTAYLASRWGNEMSISSIAYYIVWRELEHKPVKEIRECIKDAKLIKDKEIDYTNIHDKYFKSNYISDLAGLVFGVGPKKGYELLLLPEIDNALEFNDSEKLAKLKDANGEGFWTLFNQFILSREIDSDKLLKYSTPIYNVLIVDKDKLYNYLNKLRKITLNNDFDFFTNSEFMPYHTSLMFLHNEDKFLKKIYIHFSFSFSSSFLELEKNSDKVQIWVKNSYSVLNKLFDDVIPISDEIKIYELPFDITQFKLWIEEYSESENLSISKKYYVKQEMLDSLSAELPSLTTFEKSNLYIFEYILNNKVEHHWKAFHANAYNFLIKQPSSNHQYLIDFVVTLILNNYFEEANLTTYRDTWPIYNAIHHLENSDLNSAAILVGYLQRDKLNNPSPAIAHQNSSQQGFDAIKEFWKIDDIEAARIILDRIYNYDSSFIWDIIKNPEFKLAIRVISMASEEKKYSDLFLIDDKPKKLSVVLSAIDDEDVRDNITIALMAGDDVLKNYALNEKEIEYPDSIFYFLKNSKQLDPQVKSMLVNTLKAFDVERWKTEIKAGSFFLDIAIKLNEMQNGQVHQSKKFLDALKDTAEDILNDGKSVEKWTIESWRDLVGLLTQSSLHTYEVAIRNMYEDNYLNANVEFMQINQEYLEFNSLFQDSIIITELFIEIIKIKDKERFLFLIEQINNLEDKACKNITKQQRDDILEEIKKNEIFFTDLTSEEINTFFKLFNIDISFSFNKEEE